MNQGVERREVIKFEFDSKEEEADQYASIVHDQEDKPIGID